MDHVPIGKSKKGEKPGYVDFANPPGPTLNPFIARVLKRTAAHLSLVKSAGSGVVLMQKVRIPLGFKG